MFWDFECGVTFGLRKSILWIGVMPKDKNMA